MDIIWEIAFFALIPFGNISWLTGGTDAGRFVVLGLALIIEIFAVTAVLGLAVRMFRKIAFG